jgi:multidrug efflux pump subunit AcrA (membrane-fusion protein)
MFSRISPVMDAATRSALVEVEIPNRTGDLRAEMFARVRLDLASVRPAVLVPRESLVYRGQQAGVYVLSNNRPLFREVEPGIAQGNDVEILSALAPGTRIVSRGAAMVSDGIQLQFAGEGAPVKAKKSGEPGPSSQNRKQPLRADMSGPENKSAN